MFFDGKLKSFVTNLMLAAGAGSDARAGQPSSARDMSAATLLLLAALPALAGTYCLTSSLY